MRLAHHIHRAPVLLMTYRKQDCLAALHEAIRDYAPPRLYIAHNAAADYDQKEAVAAVREAVSAWRFPFPVEHVFHDKHLGINDSFGRTLDHVFAREATLIVLEDDTVPSSSFFTFCNMQLERHADDASVGSVGGCNLGAADRPDACFRTPFAAIYWGWATWASRWRQAQRMVLPWASEANGVTPLLQGAPEFFSAFLGGLDAASVTWDVKWGWAQALNRQACLLPGVNLVANHGFSPQGTFTRHTQSRFSQLVAGGLAESLPDPEMNAAFSRQYEENTAALIREILTATDSLARYGLD